MPDDNESRDPRGDAPDRNFDPRRRRLLLWLPAAVFASVAAALSTAAFRFLRPAAREAGADADAWLPLGRVEELKAAGPVAVRVGVERVRGWASVREERAVYVLPGEGPSVVSAVCPHEQCEVVWSEGPGEFLCPCHDSRFGPRGAVLSGPAARDLTRLPARVEGGVLQVLLGDDEQTGRAEG